MIEVVSAMSTCLPASSIFFSCWVLLSLHSFTHPLDPLPSPSLPSPPSFIHLHPFPLSPHPLPFALPSPPLPFPFSSASLCSSVFSFVCHTIPTYPTTNVITINCHVYLYHTYLFLLFLPPLLHTQSAFNLYFDRTVSAPVVLTVQFLLLVGLVICSLWTAGAKPMNFKYLFYIR